MDRDMTSDDRRLVRLEELKGFGIADGDNDIRGWEVKTADGKTIGKVDELIVDPVERRVRYMDVKVRKDVLGADSDRHVLVPIGTARLNEDGNDVLVERLPALGLAGVPPYIPGPISRDYETSLREYYGASAVDDSANYYGHEMYDDRGIRSRGRSDRVDDAASGERAELRSADSTAMPTLGEHEVTVPLVDDQEVIIRRPGSDQEIVIRKSTGGSESSDR